MHCNHRSYEFGVGGGGRGGSLPTEALEIVRQGGLFISIANKNGCNIKVILSIMNLQ